MNSFFDADPADVRRAPLSMVVAQRIRDAIVSGELEDGTALPSEKELATRLKVGRSTVREAVRVLQAQGLVTGGDTVSTRTPTVSRSGAVPNAASALQNVLQLGQVKLHDLVALRRVIEKAGFRAACERRDPAGLARARAALAAMSASPDDAEAFHQADIDFHAAIIDAADNQAFSLVMRVLRHATARHLRNALTGEPALPSLTHPLIEEHRALLEAVEQGNGAAAADLIDAHITGFYAERS